MPSTPIRHAHPGRCAGCNGTATCHARKVGGQDPVLICNRCTRNERRAMREHPNREHNLLRAYATGVEDIVRRTLLGGGDVLPRPQGFTRVGDSQA